MAGHATPRRDTVGFAQASRINYSPLPNIAERLARSTFHQFKAVRDFSGFAQHDGR
jgi:hypothetical protein